VGAFLVTYDFNTGTTVGHLAQFARSLCQNFPTLQAQGHPKWKEVSLNMPTLGAGWTYYAPTARELRACGSKAGARTRPPVRSGKVCTAEEKILGFCN
jgi:hypothetical protein